MKTIQRFVSALLGTAEQARHERILLKYTLPPRHHAHPKPMPKAS
jgi:hypothetical protein